MSRCYNFSAGPAVLPEAVLEQAREEMLDWHGTGMSVMEMSHRGKDYIGIAEKAEADLRELLNIPANYKVLFMQGGATSQFAMVPINLLPLGRSADYIDTGIWAEKAISEARLLGDVHVAASSAAQNYMQVPDVASWQCDEDAAYLHYTANETIAGVEFHQVPDSQSVPLVCDMSSNILSRRLDISRFGLIYAGAQKNIGPAGLTIVIVRDDLIGNARTATPTMFDYAVYAKNDSMYNTPPTYSWYLAGLVFEWLKQQGGLEAMEALNQRKSAKLYEYIDQSGFYRNIVAKGSRSWMNVTFLLDDATREQAFMQQATEHQLVNLKGHRLLGGMRASIYNAMPEAGVDALIAFMKEFERTSV